MGFFFLMDSPFILVHIEYCAEVFNTYFVLDDYFMTSALLGQEKNILDFSILLFKAKVKNLSEKILYNRPFFSDKKTWLVRIACKKNKQKGRQV